MKIRFGYTAGPETTPAGFGTLVDDLDRLGFDSLWIAEVLLQPTLDPLVALSFAAARTKRLKLGTHLILPGRHPVTLARQLAHLDQLSDGRLLLVGVIGLPAEADAGAQGVERKARTAVLEEMLPLMRSLWRGEAVSHDGARFSLRDVVVSPTPRQKPLEMWLGGKAKGALKRCGRLGDGWMPGLMLPAEAAALRPQIEQAAAAAGREIDPEHFGANLFYARGPLAPEVADFFRSQRDGDPADLVPVGIDGLRARIDEWVQAGFSKFLLRPLVPPRGPAGRARATGGRGAPAHDLKGRQAPAGAKAPAIAGFRWGENYANRHDRGPKPTFVTWQTEYPYDMSTDEECRRRLDAAREYLEQARLADSPDNWREWARRLLQDVPGREAEVLRSEC